MKREWTKKIWLKPFVLLCTTALGLTASAATYTWTGGGTANTDGSYNWNDTANWSWDGEGNLVAPTTDDTVTIGTGDAVTIKGAESEIGDTVVNRAVTLTGSFKFAYKTISSENDSVLTLSALTFKSSGGNTGTISTKVVVSGNVHNNSNSTLHFTGASVSGDSGASFTSPTGDNYSGFDFNKCDLSNFQGTISGCSRANGTRDYTEITPPDDTTIDGGSAAAVWNLGYRDNNGTSVLKTSNRTYSFGALNSLASGFSLRSLSGVTLKIGAREDQTSTLVISHVGSNNTIEKVGSGELRFASQSVTLNATAGTVTLTDSTKVPAAINVSGGATLAFANDFTSASALVSAVEDSENSDPVTISVASGKTVVLADTFANASGFSKAGDGYLELTAAPAWTGKTAVTGIGTLTVPAGSVLTLDDETTESLTLGDGRVLVYSKTAVNVWTGEANDNNWTTANNWSKGTVPATDVSTEVVLIPDGADTTITCNSTSTCRSGQLTILRNVTLTGNGGGLKVDAISGTGTLTAAAGKGKTFYFSAGSGFTVNCNLCVEDTLNCGSSVLTLYGDLSGAGTIVHGSSNQPGFHFYGSTEEFSGSYTGGTRNNGDRDGTRFLGNARGSASASWKIGNDDSGNYKSPFRAGDGVTYEFGTLDTVFSDKNMLTMFVTHASTGDTYAKNVTLKIGARENETSNVGGTLFNGTTGDTENPNKIVKVGDTSTLNLTLTTANGVVEAEAGTLNLNGSNAPVSLTITGKGATVVVADTVTVASGEEDDPDTTEVDESKAAFVPVLSEALTAAYCKLLATPGEGVTTYTLDSVAQVGENTYPTIADAVAAATGDDKAIALLQSTEEPVVLTTAGQTFTPGEFTSGAVSAVAGLGLSESEGVYTAVDNTASVWQGDAAGASWTVGSNWSTGYVPDSATAVTIPATEVEGGWLIYIGGDAQAKSLAVLGNATIQRDAGITHNGCLNVQESITTGETPATLTLNSAFIFAGPGEVTVSCPIDCKNGNSAKVSGFTSNESTGTFAFSSTLTGTGTFEFRKPTTISQDLDVVEGLTVKFDGINPTFTNDAVLKGEGTVVFTVEPASGIQSMLRQSSKWTGVCELNNVAKNGWNFGSYGNTSSTVRLNGVTGYMGFNSNTSPKNDATVKVLDIASGGLTLGDTYHSKTVVFDADKVTGSGPIKIGTRSNVSTASSVTKYVFTGDMSEFTGTLDFGTLTSNRPEIIIATSSSNLPTPTDYGQIIVAEGATAYVNNTWTAPGAMVVIGDVVVGASGSIAGDNGVAGAGTITYSTFPTAALAFRDTTYTSGLGTIPVWSGTVELPARDGSGSLALASFGRTGSKIVLNGITGLNANSIYLTDATEITATVELKGLLKLTNGSTGNNYKFAEVTGEGDMFLSATGSPGSPYYTYTFTKLTDYTGEINAVKTSDSKYAALEIGTVAVSTWTLGQKMVDLSDNCNLTTSPGSITVEVNGSSLDNHHLFKASDGDLYVIAAQVTVDETTTYFATLEAAAEFALANDAQIAKVDPATPTELPGWSYDKGYFTKVDIAQVGETTYKTLQAAIDTGTTEDIVLIADCAETVTLGAGQTVKPGTYAFSGVLKGTGTIYYAAKPTTVPTFEDWTGTFVADWDGAHNTSFPANDYGILGSVVEVRKLGGGFVPVSAGSAGEDRTVLPTISIPEGCFMKLANGYSNYKTTFTKVTGAGTMTNNTYTIEITTLENFTGEISSDVGTKIVDIVTSAAITPGTCLVKGGTFSDVASTTVNGEAPSVALKVVTTGDDAGLYFDPVAQIGTTYYNTLQEAVTAAAAINNGKVLLVGSAEGMVATIPAPSAGGRVQFYIAANGNAEGTVSAPAGDYVTTTKAEDITIDEVGYSATKYTVVEAAAAVTVNDTRTLYGATEMQTAVNAAIAGGIGSTIEFVNGTDGSAYAAVLAASGFTVDEETGKWTFTETPVAKVTHGVTEVSYLTLSNAVANATDGDTVTLLANTTLDARVDVDLGANTTLTIDLGGKTITTSTTCLNGSAFNIKSGSVTITNGFVVGVEGPNGKYDKDNNPIYECDVITVRNGAEVIVSEMTIDINSQNGACVYPFTGARATIKSGTYRNTTDQVYGYGGQFAAAGLKGMTLNQGNTSEQLVFVEGGTFSQINPALGDDSWADGEGTFLAAGYASTETSTGSGVWEVTEITGIDPADPGSEQTVTPTAEETEAAGGDAAAAAIAKATVTVPAAVATDCPSLTAETYKNYFTLEAVAGEAGAYTVTIAGLSDEVVVEPVETSAVAALQAAADGEGKVSVTVKPGLYYGFVSGDTPTLAEPETYTLATGTSMTFAKPAGTDKGFVKVVISPAPKSNN